MVVAQGWRGENGSCLMGMEFLFCKIEKFWGWLHNNVNVLNTTKLYTQKWLVVKCMLCIFHYKNKNKTLLRE